MSGLDRGRFKQAYWEAIFVYKQTVLDAAHCVDNDCQFLRCHPIRENYLAPLSLCARAEHNWGLMTRHAALAAA